MLNVGQLFVQIFGAVTWKYHSWQSEPDYFDDPSNSFKLTVHYYLLPHLFYDLINIRKELQKRGAECFFHDDFSTNSLEICADSAWHVEYQIHFQEIELDALCTMGSGSGYTFELLAKMC